MGCTWATGPGSHGPLPGNTRITGRPRHTQAEAIPANTKHPETPLCTLDRLDKPHTATRGAQGEEERQAGGHHTLNSVPAHELRCKHVHTHLGLCTYTHSVCTHMPVHAHTETGVHPGRRQVACLTETQDFWEACRKPLPVPVHSREEGWGLSNAQGSRPYLAKFPADPRPGCGQLGAPRRAGNSQELDSGTGGRLAGSPQGTSRILSAGTAPTSETLPACVDSPGERWPRPGTAGTQGSRLTACTSEDPPGRLPSPPTAQSSVRPRSPLLRPYPALPL